MGLAARYNKTGQCETTNTAACIAAPVLLHKEGGHSAGTSCQPVTGQGARALGYVRHGRRTPPSCCPHGNHPPSPRPSQPHSERVHSGCPLAHSRSPSPTCPARPVPAPQQHSPSLCAPPQAQPEAGRSVLIACRPGGPSSDVVQGLAQGVIGALVAGRHVRLGGGGEADVLLGDGAEVDAAAAVARGQGVARRVRQLRAGREAGVAGGVRGGRGPKGAGRRQAPRLAGCPVQPCTSSSAPSSSEPSLLLLSPPGGSGS
jgi:hypothetical protein